MLTLLIIVVILVLLFGGGGYYGYRGGYYGGGGLGLIGLLLLIVILFLIFGGNSWAQVTPGNAGTVPLTAYAPDSKVGVGGTYEWLRPYLLDFFGVIASAGIAWAAAMFSRLTGIRVTDSDRAAMNQAALNAAGRVLANIQGPVDNLKFDAGNPAIAAEVRRVGNIFSDEMKRLNMDPDHVTALILGKIGQLQTGNVSQPAPSPGRL